MNLSQLPVPSIRRKLVAPEVMPPAHIRLGELTRNGLDATSITVDSCKGKLNARTVGW